MVTPTDAERELGVALDRALARLLRWNRRHTAPHLPPGALSALGTLADAGPLRLGDLAAREGVAPASLTRTAALLEDQGLVSRTADPSDGRSFIVEVTAAGRRLLEDRRRERGECLAERLAPLTPAELEAMRSIVAAIEDLARS